MNIHRGVEHGGDITIRFAMTATKENRSKGVASGAKMQRRDDTHVREESEKEIQEVGAVCGTQSAFSSLQLFIRHGEEETSEERGSREVLEGGDHLFVVVTVVTKV